LVFSLVLGKVFIGSAQAAPWISPGDKQLRHHIQVLADAGVIAIPVTTYPLMWSGIADELHRHHNSIVKVALNDSERWSLGYVRHELARATESGVSGQVRIGLRSESLYLTDFGSHETDKSSLNKQLDWVGERFAAQLNVTYIPDTESNSADADTDVRLDGTFVSGVVGNWSLTAGSLNRWWGPGWQNSLILSNNARPVPGLTLQRNYSNAFETPWLSWIGPWQMVSFMGQLEEERHIRQAKLVGMRISFRPFHALEIGLSRTAQWGGEGRPENFSSLKNLLIGEDNVDIAVDGVEKKEQEPGNQLAGFDWRGSFSVFGARLAYYGQMIGEDEAGGAPAKYMVQQGLESSFSTKNIQSRLYIETTDSTCEAFSQDISNCAYEHGIYNNGYRYYDRSLGATADNDSRTLTFAGQHILNQERSIHWSVTKFALNRDGGNVASPGGNPLSPERQTFWQTKLEFSQEFQSTKFTLGLQHFSEDVSFYGDEQGTLDVYSAITLRY
jgi:hypothetical protein